MNIKSWRFHIKDVLEGIRKPIIQMVLENLSDSNRKRPRLVSFATTEMMFDGPLSVRVRLLAEFKDLIDGIERNGEVMDDFYKAQEIDQIILKLSELVKKWETLQGIMDETSSTPAVGKKSFRYADHQGLIGRERELFKLGLVLCEAAKWNVTEILEAYLDCDYPINFQDPLTNRTPLHNTMLYKREDKYDFAEMLMDSGKCDYLLRTNRGMLAYDLAYERSLNIEVADRLGRETISQAQKKGISIDELFTYHEATFPGYWDFLLDPKSEV